MLYTLLLGAYDKEPKNLLLILIALYYLKLKEGKRPLSYPTLTLRLQHYLTKSHM